MNRNKDKQHPREEATRVSKESGHKDKTTAKGAEGIAAAAPAPINPPSESGAQMEDLQDQLLRLRADFDNFRKRTLREKIELCETAAADLMLELLPVLDHFELGIKAAVDHKIEKGVTEGFEMIFNQLLEALKKHGLGPIEADSQKFDPARFEAVSCIPSHTEPEGMVLAQVRRGYMFHNKLLRPTQVVVSSGPPTNELSAAAAASACANNIVGQSKKARQSEAAKDPAARGGLNCGC